MKRCLDHLERTLPILDKIYRKTLCLQNYLLNDGHCQGLAEACQFLDHRVVNRMLFKNCGISGENLSLILEGATKMKDFKALIYKANSLNFEAVDRLAPLLQRKMPLHLEELSLIDCKIGPTLTEHLMNVLLKKNHLRKVALVKIMHNERSFESIIELVQKSGHLKELDLSWSSV